MHDTDSSILLYNTYALFCPVCVPIGKVQGTVIRIGFPLDLKNSGGKVILFNSDFFGKINYDQ